MPPQAQVPQGEISPYITASYIGQYSKKNEGLAAFYSIFPGAGLAYVGRYVFGLLVALGSIAVYVIDAIYFSKYYTQFSYFLLNPEMYGEVYGWADFAYAFGLVLIPVVMTIAFGLLSYILARKYNEALITTAAPPWKW